MMGFMGQVLWPDSVGSGWLTARTRSSKSGIPHVPSLPPAIPGSLPGAPRSAGSQIPLQPGPLVVLLSRCGCCRSWGSSSYFCFYINHSEAQKYQGLLSFGYSPEYRLTSPAPRVMYRSTLNSEEVDHAHREPKPG